MVDGLMMLLLAAPGVVTYVASEPFRRSGVRRRARSPASGGVTCPGGHQGELVEQALGVLHDADDGLAAVGPGVADLEVELGRQPGRERDLVRPASGSCPESSCSIGPPNGPCGSWDRSWYVWLEPGTVKVSFSMTWTGPKCCSSSGDLRRHVRARLSGSPT